MTSSSPNSAGDSLAEILSSPRTQRRLLWVGGGVLLVGLVVFLVAFVRSNPSASSPIINKPAQTTPHQIKAPPDPAAYKVARKFLGTAVLRQNLDSAYGIVAPAIRGTQTRKQWDKGTIAVVPYPVRDWKHVGFSVIFSYTNQMELEVDLHPSAGHYNMMSMPFYLGLVREGGRANGRWLVNYWEPNYKFPIPQAG